MVGYAWDAGPFLQDYYYDIAGKMVQSMVQLRVKNIQCRRTVNFSILMEETSLK